MEFQYFIIIIIIFLILYNIFDKEQFDAKVLDSSKEQCGSICTKTYNCFAFAHDDATKSCYLSTNPIITRPLESVYGDEYKVDMPRCNKPHAIRNDFDLTFDKYSLEKNTIYGCLNKEEDNEIKSVSIVDDTIKEIEYDKSEFKVAPYILNELNWPRFKKDILPSYFTDPNKDKILSYTADDKNEYLGQYLFKEKCLKDVQYSDCAKKCGIEKTCVGFEYNPAAVIKENNIEYIDRGICCPKTKIDKTIPRSNECKNGTFYIKKFTDKSNFNIDDILIKIT